MSGREKEKNQVRRSRMSDRNKIKVQTMRTYSVRQLDGTMLDREQVQCQ